MKSDDVARNVYIIHETEKAWLVKFSHGGQTGYIPKSLWRVIQTRVNNYTGFKSYTICIPKWLEKSIYKQYNEYQRSKAK